MRQAIANAVVGDEQKREDPTVIELEERAAAMLGQEAAVFLPTATMSNQIALKILTEPGDVVIDPGTMLLQRIPYFARSAAITRVRPITDAFDDEYALQPAPLIVRPVGEPALMIDPPLPASIIRRAPYLQVRKTPREFTA